jgi:secreted trypsin-like serine protease
LESFIKPYLTATNKVQIGPMDVIVFMELTHTNSQKSDPGYDLQDMVLLVTFKSKAKTNNGHGNNIDGIDSSNPGNAPFINLDTDPAVDDEGGGGGAAPSDP